MSKYIIDKITKSTKFIISNGGDGTKFGMRDLSDLDRGRNNYHIGNDYNTPVGTKLYAPCDGTFVNTRRVGNGHDYGNQIFFHMQGYGHTLHLAHLNDIAHLEGKDIKEGTYIGTTGNTGLTAGPHLHLGVAAGVKKDTLKGTMGDGTWINPSKFYLEEGSNPVEPTKNKYILLKGTVPLYDDNSKAYAVPSSKNREVEVLKETAAWYLIRSNDFDPTHVWIKKSSVGGTSKPDKTNVGKTAQLRGNVTLYNKSGVAYSVPSGRNRDRKILEEHNEMYLISDAAFDPSKVWVKKNSVRVVQR